MNGISVAVLITIACFGIDRIAAATFFLLSFVDSWKERFPDAQTVPDGLERIEAAKRFKLVYYLFVGVLALIAVKLLKIHILQKLGVFEGHSVVDDLFSAVVLMGGSGQIAALLGATHAPSPTKPPPEPIEIRGSVRLEEPLPRDKRSAG